MTVPALVTRGLRRTYRGRVALAGLDLEVQPGDVYGFLGPNGAGKTTAIRCMLGLIRPDAGTVSIFGESHPVRRLRTVGAMVEVPAFHTWLSGRENLRIAAAYVGLGHRAELAAVEDALARVGLAERGRDRVGGYSQGMRQRLGIARALLGSPRLLLLDEPTNGLDPAGVRDVRELVRSLASADGLTVLLSSHLLGEVESVATRVGILRQGEVVAQGAVRELLAGEVVEVAADDRELLARVVGRLGGHLLGPGDGGRERVHLGATPPHALNDALVKAGVRVQALVPRGPTLEELFLKVVGERGGDR